MQTATFDGQTALEGAIMETLGRQRCGGGKPQSAVCLAQIQDALRTQKEAPLHAWANDFCRRQGLSVMLLGDRMFFSPVERRN